MSTITAMLTEEIRDRLARRLWDAEADLRRIARRAEARARILRRAIDLRLVAETRRPDGSDRRSA